MALGGTRVAALALGSAMLAGCASSGGLSGAADLPSPPMAQNATPGTVLDGSLECVPYARAHSAVKLYGDAWTWWDQADGKFAREHSPQAGSVLVLTGYAGPKRGHVAVVRTRVSAREIRVDHANWLGDGAIYLDDPVADVSPDNDWTQVRVWNVKTGGWGARTYAVQGFIGPGAPDATPAPLDEDEGDPAQIARLELGITK
jgi:hypothetical protein